MIKLLPTVIMSAVADSRVIACGRAGLRMKSVIKKKKKRSLFRCKKQTGTFFAKHVSVLVIVCGDIKYLCGTWNNPRHCTAYCGETLQVKSYRMILVCCAFCLQTEEKSFNWHYRAHRDNIFYPAQMSLGQRCLR